MFAIQSHRGEFIESFDQNLVALMFVLTIVMVGCNGDRSVDAIVYNVSIVDVTDGSLLKGQAVVIEDGEITALINSAGLDQLSSEQVINGNGASLISRCNGEPAMLITSPTP